MKSLFPLVFVVACVLLGCGPPQVSQESKALNGVWRSPPNANATTDTEWGPIQLFFWFKPDGRYETAIDWFKSPGSDPRTDFFQGTYVLTGDQLFLDQDGDRMNRKWKFELSAGDLELTGLDDLQGESHRLVQVSESEWPGQRAANARKAVSDWDENRRGSPVRGMWRLSMSQSSADAIEVNQRRLSYWFQDDGRFELSRIAPETPESPQHAIFAKGSYKVEGSRLVLVFSTADTFENGTMLFKREEDALFLTEADDRDAEPVKFVRIKKIDWPIADEHSEFWK